MQPLVLAIEPDLRQAAIVKRIVREKVLADVTVVDSRDAAMEAMRTTVPDVLLLSALLSPRDEDELVAHLRSRRDAEHLQTHTIPQLASTIGGSEEAKPKGLLSAFKRKKGPDSAPTGCDPDLFADEIRTYLQRASEKKREALASDRTEPIMPSIAAPAKPVAPAASVSAAPEPEKESAWDSPFEWRPSRAAGPPPLAETQTRSAEAHAPIPDPVSFDDDAAFSFDPPSALVDPPPAAILDPVAASRDTHFAVMSDPLAEMIEALPSTLDTHAATRDAYVAVPDPHFETRHSHFEARDLHIAPREPRPAARVKYPLTVRKPKGWWFVEGRFVDRKDDSVAFDPESDLRGVLARLAVPATIAWIGYAEGCRIRRVRLAEA